MSKVFEVMGMHGFPIAVHADRVDLVSSTGDYATAHLASGCIETKEPYEQFVALWKRALDGTATVEVKPIIVPTEEQRYLAYCMVCISAKTTPDSFEAWRAYSVEPPVKDAADYVTWSPGSSYTGPGDSVS